MQKNIKIYLYFQEEIEKNKININIILKNIVKIELFSVQCFV